MLRYLFVICTCLIVVSFDAVGCSCIGSEDVKEARKRADLVVVGTIIDEEIVEVVDLGNLTHFPIQLKRYTVEVDQVFKGKRSTEKLTIVSGLGGDDCGVRFEVGQQYVIYAERDGHTRLHRHNRWLVVKGVYWTDICTRTRAFEESEVRALGSL